MIELVLRIVMTLILAALESLGSADSASPSAGSVPEQTRSSDVTGAVPIARDSEQAAAALSLLRAVDPCGLHNVAAAARITGHRADQIMPEESLSACQLRLNRRPLEPTWIFTARVGVAFPAAQRHAAAREEIDGRGMYREEFADPHTRSCTYTRPVGTDFGISLTVYAPTSEPEAQPCPVAKTYLMAAQSLNRLVLRAEKRTEPRFALAGIDPCAATLDVLRRLGVQGAAYPEAPYRCRIQPDRRDAGQRAGTSVTIDFRFTNDPRDLAGAGTAHQLVTVAGHPGVVTADLDRQRCELAMAHDTNVAIQIDHTRFVQTIAIDAASCEEAKVVAEVVLHNIAES